jgi:hypothetical protein
VKIGWMGWFGRSAPDGHLNVASVVSVANAIFGDIKRRVVSLLFLIGCGEFWRVAVQIDATLSGGLGGMVVIGRPLFLGWLGC